MSAGAYKPTLCLDFDGVIHSYDSPWRGAHVVSDPPVPGAMFALLRYAEHFNVAVLSSRSHQDGGIQAMKDFIFSHMVREAELNPAIAEKLALHSEYGAADAAYLFVNNVLLWPTDKPPAVLTIDDRAATFTGTWMSPEEIKAFKPWNKRG